MGPYQLPESIGEIRNILSPCIAGFLRIRNQGEIVSPTGLGSGVFVRLPGDVFGILTAAHVVETLPEDTPIGLMHFTRLNAQGQFKIILGRGQKLLAKGWRDRGHPDLGFVRLFEEVEYLKAKGCVFYDLERPRLVNTTPPGPVAYITGVLEASRSRQEAEDGTTLTSFIALLGTSRGQRLDDIDGDLIITLLPEFEEGLRPPPTYGGVSGGGLWAVFPEDDEKSPLRRVLAGIAFFEVEVDGQLQIKCHAISDVLRAANDWASDLA